MKDDTRGKLGLPKRREKHHWYKPIS